MKKTDAIKLVLGDRYLASPLNPAGQAYAPTNIALVKYWGKRDTELNLPVTSSLSISLADKGAITTLTQNNKSSDTILLNNNPVEASTTFSQRLIHFLNLFRHTEPHYFDINIQTNIPIAAGLASSACGFSALTMALNNCYGWNLTQTELSILSRLGSGSASRSIWNGFVEWHMGSRDDGMDSHGKWIETHWPEFRVGLIIMQETEKSLSSREAMQRTILTSPLYSNWSSKVQQDLAQVKSAIANKDFELLGKTSESNAMTMHALMLSAWPPINYALPETTKIMQKIWQLRQQGINLYFTQDAGPNLKLLFLEKDQELIKNYFPNVDVVVPFA